MASEGDEQLLSVFCDADCCLRGSGAAVALKPDPTRAVFGEIAVRLTSGRKDDRLKPVALRRPVLENRLQTGIGLLHVVDALVVY